MGELNPSAIRDILSCMPEELRSRPRTRILHQSMADEISAELRRMIMFGELQPGQKVTQELLAELLGVSTMPVREALLRLAADGLIEPLPNRSFTVVRLSRRDFEDIYWLQSVLQGELARRACMNADPEFIAELTEIRAKFGLARKNGDNDGMESANWQWNELISQQAKASRLVVMMRPVMRYTPRGLFTNTKGWVEEAARYYKALMSAFRAGDCDRAAEESTQHVLRAGRLLTNNHPTAVFWNGKATE